VSGPRHADRPSHTEGSPLNPDELEVAPGTQRESVEGWVPQLATEEELRIALEKAFDYRGDITVTLKNGSKIEGYVFDRVTGPTLETSFARILFKDSNQREKIGKSWEAWVRKYWKEKAAGEGQSSLQPESLE